jgi:hypothetical protein
MRCWSLALLGGLVMTSAAPAQAPAWKFNWRNGQVLTYKTEQTINEVAEEGEGKKTESKMKLNHQRRWEVLSVDGAGVATVQMSLLALRLETTTPDGEVLVYDSADPDGSNAALKEQLGKYVGQPLAVLRLNALGQVVEVKESKHGPASRFESEPPFSLVLPEGAPQPGQYWERNYNVTVDPPYGTGEKYQATQRYVCKGIDGAAAVVSVSTALKTKPEAAADMMPLLREMPEGELVFDVQAGVLKSARLRVEKELPEFQGKGTHYRFQSVYTAEYAGDK